MSDLPYSPSGIDLQTPADAKGALLEWSVRADAELLAQIQDLVAMAKAKTRKVAPWAAGAALIGGLLFGRKRKRRPMRDDGGEHSKGGKLGTIIRLAIEFAPLIMTLLRRR